MISLPRISSDRCVHALLREGFVVKLANEKGTALTRDGRVVLVPRAVVLSEPELRLILFAAHMSWEAFLTVVEPVAPSPKTSGVRLRTRDDEEAPIFSKPYALPKARR